MHNSETLRIVSHSSRCNKYPVCLVFSIKLTHSLSLSLTHTHTHTQREREMSCWQRVDVFSFYSQSLQRHHTLMWPKAYIPRECPQLQSPAAHARAGLHLLPLRLPVASERIVLPVVAVQQQAHAARVREAVVAARAQLRSHWGMRSALDALIIEVQDTTLLFSISSRLLLRVLYACTTVGSVFCKNIKTILDTSMCTHSNANCLPRCMHSTVRVQRIHHVPFQ